MLGALGRLDDPKVAEVVLAAFPKLEPELKPRAVELLTQRPTLERACWSRRSPARPSPPTRSTSTRSASCSPARTPQLAKEARAIWGSVREGRNPGPRAGRRADAGATCASTPATRRPARPVFAKLCAQCHKIYGEGQEVGPDLTGVGRSSFEGLLSNVFDPNLVIGAAYQADTVATTDGRVLTGLLAEDGPQKVVLKVQGGQAGGHPPRRCRGAEDRARSR